MKYRPFNFFKSIYLNYAINFFALNSLIIFLYIFDLNKLVTETALLASFLILLCQIFLEIHGHWYCQTKNL